MPPKLNDPEYNAEVMASWREKIAEARDLFAKLDVAGAERALQLALEQAAHFGNTSGPVATSLLNLAQLYKRSGRLDEALPLLERAAKVAKGASGPKHPQHATALSNLAGALLNLGRSKEARRHYAAALKINEAALGKDHESTREVREGLEACEAAEEARPRGKRKKRRK